MSINNRCESCGGELRFDFDSQELKCLQCEKIVDIPDVEFINQKFDYDERIKIKPKQVESLTYKCENCGRVCIISTNADTLRCVYCNSPNLNVQSKIEHVPDGIVPFKLNKNRAMNCFLDWLRHKRFLPKNLKKNINDKNFSALYFPIFNYDFDCFTSYSGIGVNYSTDSQGNKTASSRPFSGEKISKFTNFLESGNSSLSTNSLKDFGNFNFNKLYVYRTEYLYGITALEVDIPLKDNCIRAKSNAKGIISQSIKKGLNFDEIRNFICNTTFDKITYNHLYVPVWINKFNYKNKNYTYYINGSTGKVSGRVPRSVSKILLTIFGCILGAGLVGLIVYLLSV